MNKKSLAIKLVTVLVVAVVVYSVFWFFKMGQLEKRVNKFVTDNAAHISMGEVSVSGFPFSQKISIRDFKFSIPTPVLDKRQVVVKHLEAVAGIFSSEFVVTLPEGVYVQDQEGVSSQVHFNSQPQITVAIDEGRIVKLSYKDSGYRIMDDKQNLIYAAGSSTVNIDSAMADGDKVVSKINATVSDIENFSVLDIYKNSVEKDIVNGLKTGEIVVGNSAPALIPTQVDAAATAAPAPIVAAPTPVGTPAPVAAPAPAAAPAPVAAPAPAAMPAPVPAPAMIVTPSPAPAMAPAPIAAPAPVNPTPATAPNPVPATKTVTTSVPSSASGDVVQTAAPVVASTTMAPIVDAAQAVAVKSNFVLNAEYILAPNHIETQPILDPTKIQDAPLQYTKSLKINNLTFSNALYTISVNGEMTALPDDSMPSGGLSIKVENIDNLTKQMVDGFNNIIEMAKPAPMSPVADLTSSNSNVSHDSYSDFLKRVTPNLNRIVKEIAMKNAVSKDNVAQFDVRREKNLDFLINETPLREVLGKF